MPTFIEVNLANTEAGTAILNTEHIAFVGTAPDGTVQISLSNGITFPVLHTKAQLALRLSAQTMVDR